MKNRCEGFVEIYWRGKADHHVTLASTREKGYTRFGTSIQITKKGLDAIDNFWDFDEAKRRTRLRNAPDRIQRYGAGSSRTLPPSPTRKSRAKAKGRNKRKLDYTNFVRGDFDGDLDYSE